MPNIYEEYLCPVSRPCWVVGRLPLGRIGSPAGPAHQQCSTPWLAPRGSLTKRKMMAEFFFLPSLFYFLFRPLPLVFLNPHLFLHLFSFYYSVFFFYNFFSFPTFYFLILKDFSFHKILVLFHYYWTMDLRTRMRIHIMEGRMGGGLVRISRHVLAVSPDTASRVIFWTLRHWRVDALMPMITGVPSSGVHTHMTLWGVCLGPYK